MSVNESSNTPPVQSEITTENKLINLDEKIPNYTKNIIDYGNKQSNMLSTKIQESINTITQIAGQFIANKWNETKDLAQKWSVGIVDEETNNTPNESTTNKSISQEQTGGKKRKHKSRKSKNQRTKLPTKKRKIR